MDLEELERIQRASTEKLESINAILPALKLEMEQGILQEEEAKRISKASDPQVEELANWFWLSNYRYKETTAITKEMLNISSMTLSDSKIEIQFFNGLYAVDFLIGEGILTVVRKGDFKVQVENVFDSITEQLSHVVSQVSVKVSILNQRRSEFNGLPGVTLEGNEVIVQSQSSSRCFLLKLDPLYPVNY